MAGVYTTKRGKNKKGKLGQRKDAANNAANKLSQKIFSDPLEGLVAKDFAPKTLGNSATQRKREALEKARESLNLLLTGSCGNKACDSGTRDTAKQLLLCQGCRMKAYCNATCQKADWPEHKAACKEAQAKKKAEEAAAAGGSAKGESKENEAEETKSATSSTTSSTTATTTTTTTTTTTPSSSTTSSTTASTTTAASPEAPKAEVDPSALD